MKKYSENSELIQIFENGDYDPGKFYVNPAKFRDHQTNFQAQADRSPTKCSLTQYYRCE